MERLSEELLDHIVSEVIKPLPNRHGLLYDDLLNLSMVSRKFCRIVEPHIYHSLVVSVSNKNKLSRILDDRPELLRYIRAVFVMRYHGFANKPENFVMRVPNLEKLDLDITRFPVSEIVPLLKLRTVKSLRLSGVAVAGFPISQRHRAYWEFDNDTLACLDISLTSPGHPWELLDGLKVFAAVFRSLTRLQIHTNYEKIRYHALNGSVFRYTVCAFKHAFQATLRDFSFENHDTNGPYLYEEEEAMGEYCDFSAILRDSQLEKLKIDTICLHKPGQKTKLRSLELGPSCLPSSLRILYMRHDVATGNLNPIEKNLMHADEAQCLSQLMNLAARRSRFTSLQQLTLVISVPRFFEEVASRVVKVQARRVKVPLDLMFM
ncbi:hypothetical protein BDW02DRAFT_386485 [Decorospora gaudefroyi]|uniref:F-box domain-containing protein n=1 Tax=Decorospora gaudefroyi TaxID=184978 RepID=A0A6A5K7I6_9PLEO|nr:hypothetical protein BDW02DRAFT_386485 [Decorospora gaudefroyi]